MRAIKYQDFSLKTHQQNWQAKKPNLCQWELTFKCALHCRHCYADCYNKEEFFLRELNTKQVKSILDRLEEAGIIWLCFTGGDPLTREDFSELYFYAKKKGFIVTIFTNGYSMTAEIADYLAKTPPFVIEITLNAVSEDLYEKITQVPGSFHKTMQGLGHILKTKLPLKIKTQINRENVQHIPEIKQYVQSLGLSFSPSVDLHARLNGDLAPCDLRLPVQEALSLENAVLPACPGKANQFNPEFAIEFEENGLTSCQDKACEQKNRRRIRCNTARTLLRAQRSHGKKSETFYRTSIANSGLNGRDGQSELVEAKETDYRLFNCAVAGGDGFYIDPYGNLSLCNLLRENNAGLWEKDIRLEQERLLSLVRNKKFTTNSPCSSCRLRKECLWCPGRAYLETNNTEGRIKYYCELAQLQTSV